MATVVNTRVGKERRRKHSRVRLVITKSFFHIVQTHLVITKLKSILYQIDLVITKVIRYIMICRMTLVITKSIW